MSRLKHFLESIGIKPRDLSIYRRAFTHASVGGDSSDDYERLEFLGDSIVGMVISDFLFRKFPDKEEGELTRIKAMVVSGETLGEKAQELGLERYLRVDTVRVREGGHAEVSILGDCFEALTGAVFADRGYLQARSFVLRNLKDICLSLSDVSGPIDFKSQLQELWQERHKEPPEYKVVRETGPDHRKEFTVEVMYEDRLLGKGEGTSKKRAEQKAARVALERDSRKKRGGKSTKPGQGD